MGNSYSQYFTFNFQLKKMTTINKKKKCLESTDSMFN